MDPFDELEHPDDATSQLRSVVAERELTWDAYAGAMRELAGAGRGTPLRDGGSGKTDFDDKAPALGIGDPVLVPEANGNLLDARHRGNRGK